MKKTTAAFALAALAVPGAAYADGPGNAGTTTAAERQERKDERQKQRTETRKSSRTKGVGFTVVGVVKETVPAFSKGAAATSSPFTFSSTPKLDVVAANKHARAVLGLERSEIRGSDEQELTEIETSDEFRLRLNDVTDANADGLPDDLKAGDRVVIVGKVARTRSRSSEGSTARASSHGERSEHRTKRVTVKYGDVDVRKVVLSRPGAEGEGDDD